MIDILKVVEVCVKYNIRFEQYCFLMLRNYAPEGSKYCLEFREAQNKYITNVRGFDKADLVDLEKKGYLDNFNEKGQDFITGFFVLPKISNKIWIDHNEAGEELWNAYPAFIILGGGAKVPARTCDKDQLIETYAKRIKNSKKKHVEVMDLLKQAIQVNDISMGIEKWVGSEQWESLKLKYYIGKPKGYGEGEFL